MHVSPLEKISLINFTIFVQMPVMLKEIDTVKLIFGLKVAQLRKEQHLSYQQLSDKTGLAISYLHNIEKGKKYPKADKIIALAKALGTEYNYLVSLEPDKKMRPIFDLLNSDFLKIFPLEKFGINLTKFINLLVDTPGKVNAFISTVIKITRNYQLQGEDFYKAALRSYQDLHDNYFPDLERAANQVRNTYQLQQIPDPSRLKYILQEEYGIKVDQTTLGERPALQRVRSYYAASAKTLYIHPMFVGGPQELMLLAKEIGFQALELSERPYETRMIELESFEKLFNDFQASYFAVALLMEEHSVIEQVHAIAAMPEWDPKAILDFLETYKVSQEMLLQRLANLLPRHFGIHQIFFLRFFTKPDREKFEMTKEMHLSQLHNPHANQLEEHYCRRWLSVEIINRFRRQKGITAIADAQLSRYHGTNNTYLCISMAKASTDAPGCTTSVTLGLLVNDRLRRLFRWLDDPEVRTVEVHTTCERCPISDCKERIAEPVALQALQARQAVQDELDQLDQTETASHSDTTSVKYN